MATYKGLKLPEHIHQDFLNPNLFFTWDLATFERTPVDIEEWFQIQIEYLNSVLPCDCGGWTCGSHSHWCQNKFDNAKRRKGIENFHNWKETT